SQRLANHGFVDARGHVLEVISLHHGGNPASDLDVFDGSPQLGFGFSQGLAILFGYHPRQFQEVVFKHVLEFEQRLNSFFRRWASPSRIGCRRRFDRTRHLSGIGKRNSRQDFPGRGILQLLPFLALRVAPLSINIMRKVGNWGSSNGRHGSHLTSYSIGLLAVLVQPFSRSPAAAFSSTSRVSSTHFAQVVNRIEEESAFGLARVCRIAGLGDPPLAASLNIPVGLQALGWRKCRTQYATGFTSRWCS